MRAICRPGLAFICTDRAGIEAFLAARRHSRTLTTPKWRTVWVIWIRGVWSRLLSPRLLHLLPCREYVCPSTCRFWLLRSRWRSEVLARETVCAIRISIVVLRCRSLWARLRLRPRRRRAIILPPVGGARVRVARRGRRTSSRRVWRLVWWYVHISKLLPLCIVFRTLMRVAQDLVRRLDLLEFCYPFLLLARVSVWVAFECELAERFADVIVAGGCWDAQIRIVVACRINLRHVGYTAARLVEKDVANLNERAWGASGESTCGGSAWAGLLVHCFVLASRGEVTQMTTRARARA